MPAIRNEVELEKNGGGFGGYLGIPANWKRQKRRTGIFSSGYYRSKNWGNTRKKKI